MDCRRSDCGGQLGYQREIDKKKHKGRAAIRRCECGGKKAKSRAEQTLDTPTGFVTLSGEGRDRRARQASRQKKQKSVEVEVNQVQFTESKRPRRSLQS